MLKIGILCPSEIAFRRFMPALAKTGIFEYAGIAVAAKDEWFGELPSSAVIEEEIRKAERFGGTIYDSYTALLSDKAIDCVYIPLPPGLHYEWAKKALLHNKHVLVEKPCTDSLAKTKELLEIANKKNLAIHENYMFIYHNQLNYIIDKINERIIGDIRLYRMDFTFPFRGANDFRYNKALGGGALLDCGGYTLKLASLLLGDSIKVVQSQLYSVEGFEVDVFGNAVLMNDDSITAQVSFGMDNCYKCSVEVLGSKGHLFTNRMFSAPEAFSPIVLINDTEIVLEPDDSFRKSIFHFSECINSRTVRKTNANNIYMQAKLIEVVFNNDKS